MRAALIALALLCAAPASACLTSYTEPPVVATPTPSPTPLPPELYDTICMSRHLIRDDPMLMAEYWDVLACLGWEDPRNLDVNSPSNTCWSAEWMLKLPPTDLTCTPPEYLWQYVRSYTLPARDCPQAPGAWCCTNYGNNFCDCTAAGPQHHWCDCDGIYLSDYGSGPGPRRIAGTIQFCPYGPVIVAAEPNANCGNTAWRHELIHLLRMWHGDPNWSANDEFEGWSCQ